MKKWHYTDIINAHLQGRIIIIDEKKYRFAYSHIFDDYSLYDASGQKELVAPMNVDMMVDYLDNNHATIDGE